MSAADVILLLFAAIYGGFERQGVGGITLLQKFIADVPFIR